MTLIFSILKTCFQLKWKNDLSLLFCEKKAEVFALFKSIFLRNRCLSIARGDFAVINAKFERGNLNLTDNPFTFTSHVPAQKNYRVEVLGRSLSNYSFLKTRSLWGCEYGAISWKIDIVNYCFSFNLTILLHIGDTYNCDYLPHTVFLFLLNRFSVKFRFPFQILRFIE